MIDETDAQILTILQQNARTSNADLARAVGLAPSAVLERVRKLERRGVLLGYEARVAPEALGLDFTAFTLVRTEEAVGSTDTGRALAALPGVLEVHYTAGQAAYLIKVRVAGAKGLADLLKEIGRLPTVRDTNSTVVLETLKETQALPALALGRSPGSKATQAQPTPCPAPERD